MELFAIIGGVIVVIAVLLWRSRARTGGFDVSPTAGLPDDLRDKNAGQADLYRAKEGKIWRG